VSDVRDLLDEVLSRAIYPIREIEALSESEDQVELAATLVPTTADPTELDQVVTELEGSSLVRSATWTVGTTV
jgi:putative Mg2+ transporter-C (MgtC) family protein